MDGGVLFNNFFRQNSGFNLHFAGDNINHLQKRRHIVRQRQVDTGRRFRNRSTSITNTKAIGVSQPSNHGRNI